jgi:alpha-glucosidase
METDPQIYAYTRTLGDERVVVIANLSAKDAEFHEAGLELRNAGLLLANHEVAPHADADRITLRPFEARIYRAH